MLINFSILLLSLSLSNKTSPSCSRIANFSHFIFGSVSGFRCILKDSLKGSLHLLVRLFTKNVTVSCNPESLDVRKSKVKLAKVWISVIEEIRNFQQLIKCANSSIWRGTIATVWSQSYRLIVLSLLISLIAVWFRLCVYKLPFLPLCNTPCSTNRTMDLYLTFCPSPSSPVLLVYFKRFSLLSGFYVTFNNFANFMDDLAEIILAKFKRLF